MLSMFLICLFQNTVNGYVQDRKEAKDAYTNSSAITSESQIQSSVIIRASASSQKN